MEEEDDALNDGYKPPSPRQGDSAIGDEVLPQSTDQCDVVSELDDSQLVGAASPAAVAEPEEEEDVEAIAGEEAEAEAEAGTGVEVAEGGRGGGARRKRGRNPRVPARAPPKKSFEEDVCFICFDGGDLVLCDRRGCPKAYHTTCVNRDEEFFRAKGKWNCGWHQCTVCEKNSYYMCLTCPFSLCKNCIKDSVIFCVRENKGFCEACMKIIMLIEKNEQGNKEMDQVDFDDKSSWEFLFKDYWIDLKGRLSLTSDELAQAKNPWKGSDAPAGKQEAPDEPNDVYNDGGPGSDSSSGNVEARKPKRRKAKKRLKSLNKERDSPSVATAIGAEGTSTPANTEWASKELLEFVMHMKNGDKSVTSQFDVQALLLEYIKRNKLRDPRRKSQIICDSRLESLFGKPRVGHFEMLKLLESHFFNKEDSQTDDLQGSVVDSEASQLEVDGNTDTLMKVGKDRRRKARKKGDERGSQSNLDDYAAIDIHNISLIYLRRNLMEDLIEDTEKLHDKVVGAFVRIRISSSGQKQDVYRLVQVVGTSKAADPYKVGKRTTDVMLEILNLSKTEIISIDIISNQEFTEDECMRLRQSIKCGLITPLTVGGILEKALALQAVRVKDWLETEIVRLSHLRDRASEKGRRKELRECVEKLQRLKTAEERQRRLEEIPEVHADPNMDPSYESEEDESETDDKRQENHLRPRDTGFGRKRMEPSSSRKGDSGSNYSWSTPTKNSGRNWEFSRSMSNKGFSSKSEDVASPDEIMIEDSWNRRDTQKLSRWEKMSVSNSEVGGWNSHSVVRSESFSTVPLENPMASHSGIRSESFSGIAVDSSVAAHSVVKPESFSGVALESSSGPPLTGVEPTAAKLSETDKMWRYQDPSGRVQGPFSLVQLRKWSNSGYFPKDLRIWRTTEKQDDSALLTDVLFAAFPKDSSPVDNSLGKSQNVHTLHHPSTDSGKPYESSLQQVGENQGGEKPNLDHRGENWRSQQEVSLSKGWAASSMVEAPKLSTDGSVSDYDGRNDLANLPSPTPAQSTTGWVAGRAPDKKGTATEFPVQPAVDPFLGSSGMLLSPTAVTSENGQLMHSATSPSSVKQSAGVDSSDLSFASFSQQTSVPGRKEHNVIELLGALMPSSVSNSSANAPEVHPQSSVSGESRSVQADAHPLAAPDLATGSMNPGATDSKVAGASLPNLVHSVAGLSHPVETHGWGSGSISKPEIVASCPVSGGESQTWGYGPPQKLERNNSIPMHSQQPPYGHWVDASSIHNSASSLGTGNLAGYFPSPGLGLPPSDSWRPQVPSNPPNFQPLPPGNLGPPALPNLAPSVPPNMGPRAPPSFGPPAPINLGHPTPPNLGPPAPPNLNPPPPPPPILTPSAPPNMISAAPPNLVPLGPPNIIPPGPPNLTQQPPPNMIPPAPPAMIPPAPPNLAPAAPPNPPWGMGGAENPSAAPRPGPQNPNGGWGPMPGNPNMSWGPVPGNTNMNWGASGQAPAPGNAIPGWVAPTGNQGMWGSDQNHNGDRFSGQRDRGSQGGDPGYGGGRPWNRQSSFGNGGGGGSGRSTPKGQRLCVYHENGHCKKGASCDYRHS
ncbi:hypothetical protein PVL29_002690 [Vitis rotundifolia]|uniref:Zinc finger CCCH domain-containing protein 19 n=1 Tax=Vitis rotundifolia TaxID=103349 RepID=A0AA39DZT9_VITRO|nr:hypothetical protein PVL29_002690 [Vitis rotundifolia]